jgi:hypothetical protein
MRTVHRHFRRNVSRFNVLRGLNRKAIIDVCIMLERTVVASVLNACEAVAKKPVPKQLANGEPDRKTRERN